MVLLILISLNSLIYLLTLKIINVLKLGDWQAEQPAGRPSGENSWFVVIYYFYHYHFCHTRFVTEVVPLIYLE